MHAGIRVSSERLIKFKVFETWTLGVCIFEALALILHSSIGDHYDSNKRALFSGNVSVILIIVRVGARKYSSAQIKRTHSYVLVK